MMNKMREDWIECKAEEFGELIRGITYNKNQASDIPKDNYLPILRANNINDNRLNFDDIKYVEKKIIDDFQKIIPNDILIAMSSGSKHLVGKSAQSKGHYEGSFGAFCSVFRPNENLSGNYISYFFQSNDFRKNISEISKGSNINNLKREHILDFVFPIPPLPIQRAIVSKIEALFSDLDNGIANFKKAQEQLKIYRQAVLKKAFEGGFSITNEELRITNEGNLDSDSLPKGWKWVKLGEIINNIEAGKSFRCEERPPQNNEVGVLKVSAVTWGEFSEIESKTVISEDKINNSYLVKKGDFLFSRANTLELVGNSVIVNNISKKLMLSDKTLRFKFLESINQFFVLYFLRTRLGRKQIETFSTGNQVSMRNIGQRQIKLIEIPLPPTIEEQTQIVQEIERRLSVCDKMEQSIKESLAKAEALRQSILKKAFEGKLLTEAEIQQCKQEADYEPASELLKKIQAEKAVKGQATNKKKRKE